MIGVLLVLPLLMPAAPAPSAERVARPSKSLFERRRRAGRPDRVAPWAVSSYGQSYSGVYVGGGAVLRGKRSIFSGEPRTCLEGTFGVDYDPWWSRVGLSWYHGARYQGGEGQYEPTRYNLPLEHFKR